jgi:nucleoside-diphosphate-sugar epimerase
MKTILVTGGAGYLGSVLVPKLLSLGHRVRVLDVCLFGGEELFPRTALATGALELIRGDMGRRENLERGLRGADAVIHLAGISNDPSSDLDPALTRRVNVDASQFLITMAREAGVKRFINASSSSVYGIKQEPNVTEDLSLEPLTVYSESKVLIEKYLNEHKGGMLGVSVRSATICGVSPRMRLDLTINILTYHAVTRGKITVFGGSQKRPNIHIEDVSDFYCRLLDAPEKTIDGREYNICTENFTVLQLAQMVKETVAPAAAIEIQSTDDLRSYHVSAERARRELGFVPKRSLADAVREVAAAIRAGTLPQVADERFFNIQVMKRALAQPAGIFA